MADNHPPARSLVAAGLAAVLAAAVLAAPSPAWAGSEYHVSPTGSDADPGTAARPWRSVEKGMRALRPGDRLVVHGGTYKERVLPVVRPATPSAPITVTAAAGERPVIRGLLRLENADHWSVTGISVTSDTDPYGPGEMLVKFRDGVGWTFRGGEVWNARSYAAVRVESSGTRPGEPAGWRLADSCIHSTAATHPPYQDHNIYIDTDLTSAGGVIERNIVFNAPNGQNLKLGPGAEPSTGAANVTVRFNTFWGGVQNILASGGSHGNRLERNILGGVRRPPDKAWYPNIRGFHLGGARNVVADNLALHADGANFVFNDRESTRGWTVGSGNRHPVNPVFDSTTSCAGFHPSASAARHYGRYAPRPPTPRAIDDSCPAGQVREDGYVDVPPDHPHEFPIDCVTWRGIAAGTSPGRYTPDRPVSRAAMATFLARLVQTSGGRLPDDPPDAFTDDNGSVHEASINRLAAAGVVSGTGAGYEPGRTVTRAQMATFLARTYQLRTGRTLTAETDWFPDDTGNAHQANINRVATAGITGGRPDGTYGPGLGVTRGQMATFLARTLDLLIDDTAV